ncbi:MAG: hypothetical protein AB7U85_03245 [Alphaproteobacteria bacterium]
MEKLEKLGRRICILGPSSSGKSTLANALSKKLNVEFFHLDLCAHLENTDWVRKPDDIFLKDHNEIIAKENWIIDGNYRVSMPQRMARATGVIWLDFNVWCCVWRYVKRCYSKNQGRYGSLSGASREFNWNLIKFTIYNYPKNRLRYQEILQDKKYPVLKIKNLKELNQYYDYWKLDKDIIRNR